MKLETFVLQNILRKYLRNRHFLEKRNAENLQDFAQTQFEVKFFLDYRHQNINAYSNPDLSFHCVLGRAQKCFDTQILLDPFEKDFYLPAAFVKLCNHKGRQRKVVC